jgi:hypothetical protein
MYAGMGASTSGAPCQPMNVAISGLPRVLTPRTALATFSASEMIGGMKIAIMLSTFGSAATRSSTRAYDPAFADAIMSTGFVTLAAAGRNERSSFCVASERTGSSSPFASSASAARIAGPPAFVTIATRRPAGTG